MFSYFTFFLTQRYLGAVKERAIVYAVNMQEFAESCHQNFANIANLQQILHLQIF